MPADLKAAEMAECVKINLDNVARQNPALKAHPFWLIAVVQLNELILHLEGDDEEPST